MKKILSVIFKREFYLMIFTWYIFILIPFTVLLIFIGIKMDSLLGLPKFIPKPYNLLFFIFFMLIGLIIVLWSYSYLVLEGLGSPSPYFGQTKKLVKVGPYSIVRHPSVIGKLFGVISLGFLFQSFFFTFIIVPVLLAGSLIDKKFREEKQLEKVWGKEYIEYKNSVPMIIPNFKQAIYFLGKRKNKSIADNSSDDE
jgi:protein-S-isoprenylcysteine O-methyltransferase Ste14